MPPPSSLWLLATRRYASGRLTVKNIATAFAAKTANYIVTATDSVLTGDCTSANLTFMLPTAASITGRQYTFKRVDASANSVVIACNGAETIDGAAMYTLTAQWQAVTIVSDGGNWLVT